MQCLKQISPEQWQDVPALRQFVDDLPRNPYCTNSKGFTYIRNKQNAVRHRYIQPNHPKVCKWLAFDIDDPEALFTYSDNGLPPPQIIIKNPTNGHAHYLYRLTTPIGTGGKSSMKAVRYLASVQKALATALGADKGYSGNLIKNPCYVKANAPKEVLPIWAHEDEYEENGERDEHETYIVKGVQSSYTLAELADYLDLEPLFPQTTAEPANDAGYGRNCTLFNELRHIAYKLPDKSYNSVISELESISDSINNRFDVPLPYNEVKHIIKSIARYCSRTDFTESHKRFSERQAVRGTRGGKVSKRKPVVDSERTTKPWLELGISRATYYRDLKRSKLNENNSQR